MTNAPEFYDGSADRVHRCAERIVNIFGSSPSLAIVLGSGFHTVASAFDCIAEIQYSDLPGFPVSAVPGHHGCLRLCKVFGIKVILCCGRSHYYEGHDMASVTFPVRVLAASGTRDLVLTNAAGGINPRYAPGDFVLVRDHINFTGVNPLRGLPANSNPFVDLTDAYSPRLGRYFRDAARTKKIKLHTGVYLGVAGPSYETPAEIRAFGRWGADAVGMSTIPEVLVARHLSLEVSALSCITNKAAGLSKRKLAHEDVLRIGRQSAVAGAALLRGFIEHYTGKGVKLKNRKEI